MIEDLSLKKTLSLARQSEVVKQPTIGGQAPHNTIEVIKGARKPQRQSFPTQSWMQIQDSGNWNSPENQLYLPRS